VRAVRLETTPTGSYWNASQGAFASTNLPNAPAAHSSYGSGCYDVSNSVYAHFPTPSQANTVLSGLMLVLTPQGGGYLATSTLANFMPPSANATTLALANDGQVAVPLLGSLAFPGGSTTQLHVHENGIVALAPLQLAQPGQPSVAAMPDANAPAFWSWRDLDSGEAGSGPITYEQVGNVVLVTYDDVESIPAPITNRSTVQFQFDLATGEVRIVWVALGNGFGDVVCGWSPAGKSLDLGPTDFASGLPRFVPVGNRSALRLAASPAPISTPTVGTSITWTIDNMPEIAPGSGLTSGAVLFSLTANPTGAVLDPIVLPSCGLWVATLDVVLLFTGTANRETLTLDLPAGLPHGTLLYSTAAALVLAGTLPGGQNPFGLVTSNGVQSYFAPF
jgi:hypothetical protein